jgi:hypothetical protein
MRSKKRFALAGAVPVLLGFATSATAQFLVVGDDNKLHWNDAGKPVFTEPGKAEVSYRPVDSVLGLLFEPTRRNDRRRSARAESRASSAPPLHSATAPGDSADATGTRLAD